MKKYIVGLVTAFLLLVTVRLQAQELTLKPRVSGFSTLKVSSGVQVFLTQGDTESVRIESRGFTKEDIIAEVDGGELKLSIRLQGWLGRDRADRNTSRYVKAYLTAKHLTDITVASGAQLTGEGTFKADRLAIHSKSGAEITLDVAATDVELSAGAGATANVAGSATTVAASASGGATVRANDLKTNTCQAEASSGATVRVYADNEFFLKASTGGTISHSGPGRIVSRKTSLGGSAN
ncbi:DUF2807 domain-containing protein [Fibrella sp. HMF5335]|uniref:DUF2807 domain-containing protein n=1 Tax=Fibrella rubiginis TaxID=2817060 RepID=A0A939GHT3_9BACT|nr:head GIN domain-containing protein [Fibrella rubiginis]MBO0937026.1 DUF2807 domain-containing protein [Fibrella rubiginis]